MDEISQSPAEADDEWLDVTTVCALIGGSRPIHPSTLYRGIRDGRFSAPVQRSKNVKRWSKGKIQDDLRRLATEQSDAA